MPSHNDANCAVVEPAAGLRVEVIEAEAAGREPAAATVAVKPTAEAGSALHATAAGDAADPADPKNPRGDADARSAAAPDSFSASHCPNPSHQSDVGALIDAVDAGGTAAVDTPDAALLQPAAATDRAQVKIPGGADEVLSSISSSQSPPASAEGAGISHMMADTGHGRRELRAAVGLMQLLKELARAGARKSASGKEQRAPSEAQVLLLLCSALAVPLCAYATVFPFSPHTRLAAFVPEPARCASDAYPGVTQ